MLFLRRHSFPLFPLCAGHGRAEGDGQGDTSGGHGKGLADGLLERGGPKTSGFVGNGNSKESGWEVEGRGGETATWRGGHRRGLSGRAGRE
uniref:Uncharacterized protein n=1 Tax=Chromera velia CCMP2878 TaxID=1169474 RepID=A0A0G4F578_9ALVE|eukprot:Cvel_15216.t1-p1 / transcript=Cvel_15216.t1 / gene=Cvel_15216 / organism=Chromera_velia_CCMP2878 / gene_product=hypothetical protein / transcript_product=hypothetical protein / location=Cvel_scaffold1113:18399-18668(-) / protein_length=90 / sequence_SO=supercontig / SO=protein_coding / is_pseudo=false